MSKLFRIDKNSIQFKLWKYFISFSALILILLWLFQIVFLNNFYKTMKINQINHIGNSIIDDFGKSNFQEIMVNYAFKKGISIQVVDKDRKLIFPINIASSIIPSKFNGSDYGNFIEELERDNVRSKTFVIEDPLSEDDKSILFVGYLGENSSLSSLANNEYFLVITTPLGPVDTTTDILKTQLFMVSILSLILALFLSYFIAKRLSKPLREMSKTVEELEKGNYSVEFKDGSYTEVNNLANTLNSATEEINRTMEMRKDLIANVSHDLKTPLTVIKSYGEMIRDISGNNEKKRNEHLETIISEADNLTILVNDLLDISKIEVNMDNLKMTPFDIKKTTEKVLKRFKLRRDYEGYSFIIEAGKDNYIIGDEQKIEQVIYNLISNAINYTGSDKIVKILIESSEDCLTYNVIDTGIGIAEDDIDQIWDRYYRGKNNHHRPVVGTGLGLYIVKTILELHDFKYGVNSTKGEGSNFYFKVFKN